MVLRRGRYSYEVAVTGGGKGRSPYELVLIEVPRYLRYYLEGKGEGAILHVGSAHARLFLVTSYSTYAVYESSR
jgi:hypothetical protein